MSNKDYIDMFENGRLVSRHVPTPEEIIVEASSRLKDDVIWQNVTMGNGLTYIALLFPDYLWEVKNGVLVRKV